MKIECQQKISSFTKIPALEQLFSEASDIMDFNLSGNFVKYFLAISVGTYTVGVFCTRGRVESKTSKPYTTFNHPHKNLLDKIFCFILYYVVPFHHLLTISHKSEVYWRGRDKDAKRNISILQNLRRRIAILELNFFHWPGCYLWNRLIQKYDKDDFLVGGTVLVQRHSSILNEWGFGGDQKNAFIEDDPIQVEVTCAASTLKGNYTLDDKKKSYGYQAFQTCKLQDVKVDSNVPIILYFHGGGFVVGNPRDYFPNFIHSLLKKQASSHGEVLPILLASVKYRLCPEHPFPAAVIDCLSTTKEIIERYPKNDIHLVGFSAGGNLATTVGFECTRQYPGRVKSIVALQPFLCPRANSTSYHMNQSCAGIVTPSVLRWLWFSYLQLGMFDENNMGKEIAKHSLFQLGGIGSINPLLRLCYPTADAPYHLRQTEGKPLPPEIFVVEGSGDPLRDDARDLIETLEQHCDKVNAYEAHGSHGLAIILDLKCKRKLRDEWSTCIWS